LNVSDWETGENERERERAGGSSLAGQTLESVPRETKGEGREMSTLL